MPTNRPDFMDYDTLQQEALLGVVRAALRHAAELGLPGDHTLRITFRTAADGVVCPPELLRQYPEDMTIVLQNNQFRELAPGEAVFDIVLAFGGQPKNLTIPYRAITHFWDPAVDYSLQFNLPTEPPEAEPEEEPASPRFAKGDGGDEPKIVSLDQFRKK